MSILHPRAEPMSQSTGTSTSSQFIDGSALHTQKASDADQINDRAEIQYLW